MAEEKSKEKKDEKGATNRRQSEKPVWEWLIAAAGLILVLGTIGAAIYRAVSESEKPPQLEIVVDSQEPSGSGFLVRFTVKNTGDQTAAAVTIEGELINGTETAETSSATLTYAPARSARRGGLYFTKNPQNFKLNVRAAGYEEP